MSLTELVERDVHGKVRPALLERLTTLVASDEVDAVAASEKREGARGCDTHAITSGPGQERTAGVRTRASSLGCRSRLR
jgi:hypothetical protein